MDTYSIVLAFDVLNAHLPVLLMQDSRILPWNVKSLKKNIPVLLYLLHFPWGGSSVYFFTCTQNLAAAIQLQAESTIAFNWGMFFLWPPRGANVYLT